MNGLGDSNSTLILTLMLGTFLTIAVVEAYRPIIEQDRLLNRWRVNFSLFVINTGLIRLFTVIFGVTAAAGAGLASELSLQLPGWMLIVLSILLLDLTSYLTHRLSHAVSLLWAFHAVHHSDDATDLTTGWRFHPLELLLYTLTRVAVVLALGIPAIALVIYEVLVFEQNLLSHANLRMSEPLQRVASLLFITPWDHRVHHGTEPTTYNSNFGTLFSFWDRIFRTRRDSLDLQEALRSTGISGLPVEKSRGLISLMMLPGMFWRVTGSGRRS